MCNHNHKIKQYQNLLFWRNIYVFGSSLLFILGFLFMGAYFLFLFLPYICIVGTILFAKNNCPFCDYPFFIYEKDSFTNNYLSLFSNHCINRGEPKNQNLD